MSHLCLFLVCLFDSATAMMTNMTAGGEEETADGRQVTNQPAVTWQPIGRVGSFMSPSTRTNNQEEGGGGGGAS